MVGWYLRFDGHEFEQASGGGDGQGSLVCCSPDTTNRIKLNSLLVWLLSVNIRHLRYASMLLCMSVVCSFFTAEQHVWNSMFCFSKY